MTVEEVVTLNLFQGPHVLNITYEKQLHIYSLQ
jgi:hypothetical protein